MLCVLNKRSKTWDVRKILEVMDRDTFSTLVVVTVSWMVVCKCQIHQDVYIKCACNFLYINYSKVKLKKE